MVQQLLDTLLVLGTALVNVPSMHVSLASRSSAAEFIVQTCVSASCVHKKSEMYCNALEVGRGHLRIGVR